MDKRSCTVPHGKEVFSIAMLERSVEDELIFFIHGLGCAKESFADAWSAPELRGYSLTAPDLIGFGDSSKPADFSYSMEAHADVCLKLLADFPHQKIHIAAHSMGGAVGLILAKNLGKRLTSFTNIEGNLVSHDCSMSTLSNTLDMERYHKHMIDLLAGASEQRKKGGIKLWHQWIQKAGTAGLYRSARSLSEWSCSGKLLDMFLGLTCRKIYIYGEANSSMPVIKHLGKIPRIPVPGSGHFPMNDNSYFFYISLADFLKSL